MFRRGTIAGFHELHSARENSDWSSTTANCRVLLAKKGKDIVDKPPKKEGFALQLLRPLSQGSLGKPAWAVARHPGWLMISSGWYEIFYTVHGIIAHYNYILSIKTGLSTTIYWHLLPMGDDQDDQNSLPATLLQHCQVPPEPVGEMRPTQLFERLRCDHEEVRCIWRNLEALAIDAGNFTWFSSEDGDLPLLTDWKLGFTMIYLLKMWIWVNLPEDGALAIEHGDPKRNMELSEWI